MPKYYYLGREKSIATIIFDIYLLDIKPKSGYNYIRGLFSALQALRMEDEVRYRKNVYHALTMITQFGINMLVPIFLCSFIGIYIDRKFDTSFWMVLLFFVGALAGFRNVFVFARRIYTMKSERDTAHGRKADASGRTGSRREQGGKGR